MEPGVVGGPVTLVGGHPLTPVGWMRWADALGGCVGRMRWADALGGCFECV